MAAVFFIEKNRGSDGRLRAERGGLARDSGQFHDALSLQVHDEEIFFAVHRCFSVLFFESCDFLACGPLAFYSGDVVAVSVPACSGQSAYVAHRFKFAVALRPDLHAQPDAVDFTRVFALDDAVLIVCFRGVDRCLRCFRIFGVVGECCKGGVKEQDAQ